MICRMALVVSITLAAASSAVIADGEKYELRERYVRDDVCTVNSQIELSMDIRLTSERGESKAPVKGRNAQKYIEKVLKVDEEGRPTKVARYYEKSTMETEKPDGTRQSRRTSFDGNTYIIEKTDKGVKVEHLGGKEVGEKEQKELAAAVEGNRHKVLPGKKVELGDTWDVPLEAVREIFSIDQEIKGSAKATFEATDEIEVYKWAIIKLEMEIEVPQGSMTLKYKAQGKVEFDLKKKKIVGLDSLALIEVSGSQKSGAGEVKFSGGGNVRTSFKSTPGKGEINLTPPKEKEEGEKKEETDK